MNREPPLSLRSLGKRALRVGRVGEAARRIGALRGRSLVLVYHRIDPNHAPARGVVPCVSSDLLRRQIETLEEVGEIVPLQQLLRERERHARPRFALTFDDDYVTHVDHALPILRAFDAPATFFLSGRSLHGLGSYWFELLDGLITSRGRSEVSRLLNARADGLGELASVCETDPTLREIIEAEAPDAPRHLDREDIEALADAGMGIGFHTVHHETLTRLHAAELEVALTHGRKELEEVVGHPLAYFAYPHGKADQRIADQVQATGYEAAWTGRPQPMRHGDNRYLLGRWEPGRLDVDDFLVGTAVRLTVGIHR